MSAIAVPPAAAVPAAERRPAEPVGPAAPQWLAHGEPDLPGTDGWLSDAEAAVCARMRFAKRRREFQVSRWAAKQAMAARQGGALDPAGLEVRHHPSGAPEAWAGGRALPVGISLSDRAGWAVCLLGLGPGEVGCDLELVEPRSAAFVRCFFTAAECRLVGQSDLLANLVWSAKESALKVLRTGLRRDTRTVEVRLGETGADWSPLTVRIDATRCLPGWWARFGDFVFTVVTAVPTPPPVGLEGADRLRTAVPVHSWLGSPLSPPPAHRPCLVRVRR